MTDPVSRKAHRRTSRIFRAISRESGAEVFEFAMVIPILAMLLLGIIWMGRAYNVYQTITRAAREGTRYAVLPNCATCGDNYLDTYSSANTCLSTSSNIFTNYVSPALTASNLDPSKVSNYCQEATILNSGSNSSVYQCGVVISFSYPMQLAIPFTSLNGSTINIKTQVQMRMENQSVDETTGSVTCP